MATFSGVCTGLVSTIATSYPRIALKTRRTRNSRPWPRPWLPPIWSEHDPSRSPGGMTSTSSTSVVSVASSTARSSSRTSARPTGGTPRGKRPSVALPEGSASMIRTRLPSSASAAARLTAVVLLPTPPFALVIATLLIAPPFPSDGPPASAPVQPGPRPLLIGSTSASSEVGSGRDCGLGPGDPRTEPDRHRSTQCPPALEIPCDRPPTYPSCPFSQVYQGPRYQTILRIKRDRQPRFQATKYLGRQDDDPTKGPSDCLDGNVRHRDMGTMVPRRASRQGPSCIKAPWRRRDSRGSASAPGPPRDVDIARSDRCVAHGAAEVAGVPSSGPDFASCFGRSIHRLGPLIAR